jgi:methylglutaconyl-CoA hydratase
VTYATIQTEVDGAVGILTLNRADRHNAFDDVLRDELSEALRALEANPQVRVVVLSAVGKSFCAGADAAWLRHSADADEEEQLREATALVDLLRLLDELQKPTVARIQGPAYGIGVGLVAACDVAVATYDAQFALAEVRQGLLPAEVTPYLVAAIGEQHARRYLLTASRFSAAEAYRLGLVHEIVADEELLDEAVGEVIDQLLKGAPGAQAAGKALLRNVARQPHSEEVLAETARCAARQRTSDEAREGAAALFDKRKPDWQENY